jgi:hypothetical protein
MSAVKVMAAACVLLILGTAALLAQGGGDEKAQLRQQLAQLRKEKADFEKIVEEREEKVIYWEGEVRANPKGLVPPIALRGAQSALESGRARLKILELRISRLEKKLKGKG